MAKKKSGKVEGESKRDKFKRVVEPRVSRVLKGVRLIGNCATSAYGGTTEDWDAIVVAIAEELKALTEKVRGTGSKDSGFKLD